MSLIDPALPVTASALYRWTFAKSWHCSMFPVWIWIPPIEILNKKQCNSLDT